MTSCAPAAFGPYRVVGTLGQGGMGTVFRAVHREGGAPVALKAVTEVRGRNLASLRREIHALSRLDHPGVVRILDHGVEAGAPWYAMELVEGVPLRRTREARATETTLAVSPWWTRSIAVPVADAREARPGPGPVEAPASAPRDLARILTLMRQLCETLAHLHGEGVVHRDLKPDNVLVRPDGSPILVDFGLASRFEGHQSHEPLEVGGVVAGTLRYMAPEQLRGDRVDARADLYALGCLFYELLTGRPPHVARSRLGRPSSAPPPSSLAKGLPPSVDDLVGRLLAWDPGERLGYAVDAVDALVALGAGPGFGPDVPAPRPYLYRAPCVGRSQLLADLRVVLEDVEEGRGGVLLLGGESGVGKTRLASEVALAARRRGALVLVGSCSPAFAEGRGVPLEPLLPFLRRIGDHCRAEGAPEASRLLGAGVDLLARFEPSLRHVPGASRDPEPPQAPEVARVRLWTQLRACATALADDRPVVLVLDDLQWADELTVGFLLHLLRSEPGPVLVVGTYRAEEVGPVLAPLVESADRVLAVDRLGESDLADMAAAMLALPARSVPLSRFLMRHSEGNPLFAAEYLRAAVTGGVFRRDAHGRWSLPEDDADLGAVDLPGSLAGLLGRRLSAVSPPAREVIEAACVLGREFDESLLEGVADLAADGLVAAATELLAHGLLEEAGQGRLRFAHDKLREVAYARLSPTRRRAGHRRVAEVLEALSEDRRAEHLSNLGRHWREAGDLERARPWFLAAARDARDRYVLEEAERLYRAYLEGLAESSGEAAAARTELAFEVLRVQGATAEALQMLREAVAEARATGADRVRLVALTRLAHLCVDVGDFDRATRDGRAARELAATLGDPLQEGVANEVLAHVDVARGKPAAALARLQDALERYRAAGDAYREGSALVNLAGVQRRLGDLKSVQTLYDEALERFRAHGARWDEAASLAGKAAAYEEIGDLGQARVYYQQALSLQRRIGDRLGEARTLTNYANLFTDEGDLDTALATMREARLRLRETGDRRMEAVVLANLGDQLRRRNELEEAEEHLHAARDLSAAVGDRLVEAVSLRRLAEVAFLQLRIEPASTLIEEALEILAEIRNVLFEADSLVLLAAIRQAQGRVEDAWTCLARALAVGEEADHLHLRTETLVQMARLARQSDPDPERAARLCEQAEASARKLGNQLLIGDALCQRGHLDLATGQPASTLEALAALGLHPSSYTAVQLAALERAAAAHEAGEPLVRGEHPEHADPWVRGRALA